MTETLWKVFTYKARLIKNRILCKVSVRTVQERFHLGCKDRPVYALKGNRESEWCTVCSDQAVVLARLRFECR